MNFQIVTYEETNQTMNFEENARFTPPRQSRVLNQEGSVILQQQQLLQNLNARLEFWESRRSHGAPAPKVALPDKFDGNITRCKRFLASVENIFSLQADRYYST